MNPIQERTIARRRMENLHWLYEAFVEESGEEDTVENFVAYVGEEDRYSHYTREECEQVFNEAHQ